MKITTNKCSLSIILWIAPFVTSHLHAQQNKFDKEIEAFKKLDSTQASIQNPILFIGSSSFRKWTDVQNYFPQYPIINRAFGGSTLLDVIHFAAEVVYPHHPKQVIIYCGENDLSASDTVTAQMVYQRFITLFTIIRNKFKNLPIAFVSMKPSPKRIRLLPKMVAGNQMIKSFLNNQKNAHFIDVYPAMLQANGYPIGSIFGNDSLHMNAGGYAIWQKIIQPYLLK